MSTQPEKQQHQPPEGTPAPSAERLAELYARAEAEALRTVAWYQADRRRKRRAARLLRLGTVLGVAGGAVLPLLELTRPGYLALLGAAVCLGCDRYLGLTSGWLRDVAAAQAVQRRLESLRYEWAAETLGPAPAAERCLEVLRRFSDDVTGLVRAETADWMRDLRATPALPAAALASRPEPPRRDRTTPDPALRPTMPRQRPPGPDRG